MSAFSVPDGGVPYHGIADVSFPLDEADAAYTAVGALLAAIDHSASARNAAADRALASWTGPYADYFRGVRAQWLDGRQIRGKLQQLQARLLAALKSYQSLQQDVVAQRRRAEAANPTPSGHSPRFE